MRAPPTEPIPEPAPRSTKACCAGSFALGKDSAPLCLPPVIETVRRVAGACRALIVSVNEPEPTGAAAKPEPTGAAAGCPGTPVSERLTLFAESLAPGVPPLTERPSPLIARTFAELPAGVRAALSPRSAECEAIVLEARAETQAVLAQAGMTGAVLVPGLIDGVLVAYVALERWSEARPWGADLLALLGVQTHCLAMGILGRRRLAWLDRAQDVRDLASRAGRLGVWEFDRRTRTLEVDDGFLALLGLTRESRPRDVEGWVDLLPADDCAALRESVAALAAGDSDDFEAWHRIRHADGGYRWMLARGLARRDATGEVTTILGVDVDITERVVAEHARRERETQHAQAVELAGLGSWRADAATGEVTWSAALHEIFGTEPGGLALTREAFLSRVHEADRERVMAQVTAGWDTRQPYAQQFRIRRPDGTVRHVHTAATFLPAAEPGLGCWLGVVQDVTERVQATQALAQSEARFRSAFEESAIGMAIASSDGRYEQVNVALAQMLGYEPDELIGRSFLEFTHPDDRALTWDVRSALVEGTARSRQFEKRYVTKDGRVIWAQVHTGVLRDEHGNVTGGVGQMQDVTDRVAALEALEHSEARFATAFRHNPVPQVIFEFESDRLIDVNEAFEAFTGFSHADVVGHKAPFWDHWKSGVVRDQAREQLRRDGRIRDLEAVGITRDGKECAFLLSADVVELDGRPCILGALRDVTEQRRAQQALQASAARLQAFARAVPDLSLIFDEQGRYVEVLTESPHLLYRDAAELLGHTLHEVFPKPEADRFLDVIQLTLATGSPQQLEYELELPAGPTWFEGHSAPLSSLTGGPDSLVLWIARDITEHKRLEREVVAVTTREQQRLAGALHDGLGQQLTGIAFLAKALENALTQDRHAEAAKAAKLVALVHEAITETRELSRLLQPLPDSDTPLSTALFALASRTESVFGIATSARVFGPHPAIDRHAQTELYHIAQEAVTNAVKHAGATTIKLALHTTPETITLSVRDDGRGFDPEASRALEGGLRIMRARAQQLGASLTFHHLHGGGTEVRCHLPWQDVHKATAGS